MYFLIVERGAWSNVTLFANIASAELAYKAETDYTHKELVYVEPKRIDETVGVPINHDYSPLVESIYEQYSR